MDTGLSLTRRHLFGMATCGIGHAALASLFGEALANASNAHAQGPQFPPKAKRVIYLHMVGAPPHSAMMPRTLLSMAARITLSPL